MSWLNNKHPIVISAELAEHVGLNEAIVLQQLNYWIESTDSGVEHDGRRWIYNTIDQWRKQFTFWSHDTIKRTFRSLESKGLVLVAQLAKTKHDRTNYYTVDHSTLARIQAESRKFTDKSKMHSSNDASCTERVVHSAPVEEGSLHPSNGASCPDVHTEITTEITTETLPPAGTGSDMVVSSDRKNVVQFSSHASSDKKSERPADMPGPKDPKAKTYQAWGYYAFRYKQVYGTYPLWNKTVAAQFSKLVDAVGVEAAPHVASYYVKLQKKFYTENLHPVSMLLKDCAAIHTQWKTQTNMTSTKAAQVDKTQTNFDAAGEAEALIRARHAARSGNANG